MSALETLFRHEVRFFEQVRQSFRANEAIATHTPASHFITDTKTSFELLLERPVEKSSD